MKDFVSNNTSKTNTKRRGPFFEIKVRKLLPKFNKQFKYHVWDEPSSSIMPLQLTTSPRIISARDLLYNQDTIRDFHTHSILTSQKRIRRSDRQLNMYPTNDIHVLVLGHPVQGHINPILQFSKRLAAKGLKVTFLVPISTKRLLNLVNTSSVHVEYISDGFDNIEADKLSLDEYLDHFRLSVSQSLSDFIQKHQCSQQTPARVLVYDSFDFWALDVAIEHGMHGAAFFTQSCVVTWIYYLAHQGTLKLPLEVADGQGCVLSEPQAMSVLGLNDFPSFIADVHKYPAAVKVVLGQFSNLGKVKWLLFNTLIELEEEVRSFKTPWQTLALE